MLPSSSCTGCPSSKEKDSARRATPVLLWSCGHGGHLGPPGLPPQRSVGRLTSLYRHLVDVRRAPVLQLEHLPFKKLLSWGRGSREVDQAGKGLLHACPLWYILPALVDAYESLCVLACGLSMGTSTTFPPSRPLKPQSGGPEEKHAAMK